MIVRITRLLLLIQFLLGAGIFLLLTKLLHVSGLLPALLLSIFAIVVLRLGITANNFLLAARYRSETPQQFRIGFWQACTLFGGEFRATMLTSSWTMPFRTFTRRVPDNAEGYPVLLVHGYGCNSGYWNAMSKALLKARVAHHAVNLEPVIGSIDDYVPIIHDGAERLCRESGFDKIIIVAHSMGGLAARAYLRDHGSGRLKKVITLGTPHHGTALAHFGVGVNTHQMRWTASEQEGLASDWLRQLAAHEDPSTYRLMVSIYSHHDNIISPQISSRLHGAKNVELHGIGHVALGLDPVVQALVIREIRAASKRLPMESGPALQPA